jgi:MFS family permease
VQAGGAGWGDPKVITAFCVGAVLLAGFVIRERRAAEPMLPLRLFRSRTFSAANISAFLMSGSVFSAAFLTSQYFQMGMGYSPFGTGLRLLPWTATPMLVAPVAGALADRIGPRPLLVTGLALQAAGLAWVADIAVVGAGYAQFVAPLIIAGLGISMTVPTVAAAALGAVPAADLGKASGVNNTLQRFGGAFGVAIATAAFAAYGHLGSPASVVSGYRPAVAVSAGLSLVGAIVATAVARRKPAPAGPAGVIQAAVADPAELQTAS